MPYWEWTQIAQIPDSMFNGVLTPIDSAFAPFTKNIGTFTAYLQPSLKRYWNGLSSAQRNQLNAGGYTIFDVMWNDVTGNGDPTNEAFAQALIARYLTRSNPKLSPR